MVHLTPDKLKGDMERARHDQYFTPQEPVDVMCRMVQRAYDRVTPVFYPARVLDPSAGQGVWGKVWKRMFPRSKITGIDIDPSLSKPEEYDEWITGDFLEVDLSGKEFDLILTNPPFKFSEEFVNKGWEILPDYGTMAYLLNLTFLGGIGRRERMFDNFKNPTNVVVSSRRIDFTGQGSPHTEVAMFIWHKLPNYGKWETNLEWVDWKEFA